MDPFREQQIDYFQSLTNWTNRQDLIDFLDLYHWNLDLAIDGFLSNPNATNNNRPNSLNLYRVNSKEADSQFASSNQHSLDQSTISDNNRTSLQSSYPLQDSLNHQRTTHHSDRSDITSNGTTFIEHVNQILISNVHPISPMFPGANPFENDKRKLLQYIDSNIIGKDRPIITPWGTRKLTYADYTASGRAITFVEYYILNNVLPYYANTHSENNASASQTTKFRESSRAIIKKCVNATDEDALIFTGSGSTAAINKLVNVLRLSDENIRDKAVVFVSTFEHHSNILPWKETGIELIRIPNTKQGLLDQNILKTQLEHYFTKKHIICTFNAASNVTGILTDVDTISTLVHKYNGWIFWDYAAGAPYLKMDMNTSETAYKDAIFISPHKFVGGPATPGILIAKKKLFTNKIPTGVGGGTVNFVTRTQIEYSTDIETREEGGTPNILGAIRAGLVFHLKESVGYHIIETRENELVQKFFTRFRKHKTLFILGSTDVPRLAIFSFLIYVPTFDKYLHHNFICVLLNDLFGIQVRSGCSCAGPYVLELLHIDDQTSEIYTKFITADESGQFASVPHNQLMKPGFTRFNLSYFASDTEVDYILNSLEFVANEGWKFLPLYTYNPATAIWSPRDMPKDTHFAQFHSLRMINYDNGQMQLDFHTQQDQLFNSNVPQTIMTSSSNDPIAQAQSMVDNIPKYVFENVDFRTDPSLNIPNEYQNFVWFVIPKQIIRKMVNDYEQNEQYNRIPVPFRPQPKD